MKRLTLILLPLLLLSLSITTYAHGGNTDDYGGHIDSSTGTYHYHHGYSAHSHPDGICPHTGKEYTDEYNYYLDMLKEAEEEKNESDTEEKEDKNTGTDLYNERYPSDDDSLNVEASSEDGDSEDEERTVWDWVKIIFGMLSGFVYIGAFYWLIATVILSCFNVSENSSCSITFISWIVLYGAFLIWFWFL